MRLMPRRRPQPALVVAFVALIAATGGSAAALPGGGSVDRNDVRKNAIRSKAIKDGQVRRADIGKGAVTGAKIAQGAVSGSAIAAGAVTGAAIADGAVGGADIAKGGVTGAEIADGTVGESDIAPIEPYHDVGGPGEPQFFDGGEGDCIWKSGVDTAPGTAPVGFARDALGRVHLRGVATATAGPGGDGKCDLGEPGEAEDGLVFVLPPAYRPAYFDVSGVANGVVIAPDVGAVLGANPIPPGGVFSALTGQAVVDGVSTQAATSTTGSAQAPARISLRALASLGH